MSVATRPAPLTILVRLVKPTPLSSPKQQIPFSKPNGKSLFFEKTEIDAWLLQNKNQSDSQIENLATEYINKSRKK